MPLVAAQPAGLQHAAGLAPTVLATPALITVNRNTNALEFWPLSARGGKSPQTFATGLGLSGADAMAANGSTLYIANSLSIVTYDVVSKRETRMPDAFGIPLDIAIGKDTSLYVANDGNGGPSNVLMYPPGSTHPRELICPQLAFVDGVAVNNEGDILVGGWEAGGAPSGIFEIPNGPHGPEPAKCYHLPLKDGISASIAGYAVNPKTDDLIVLDNPSQCAGGAEGRITIYPRPYDRTNSTSRILGGNCTGGLWLSADTTIVYYGDTDVSGSFNFIRQATFPGAKQMGTYWGGASGPFVTIPNALPN